MKLVLKAWLKAMDSYDLFESGAGENETIYELQFMELYQCNWRKLSSSRMSLTNAYSVQLMTSYEV